MRISRVILSAAVWFLIGLWFPLPAHAQSDAARLQGIITDPTGALVPEARVAVTDLNTNRVLETSTDPATGAWSFAALPPGNYELQVTKEGFKTVRQKVTLVVAQVANVNFVLETGVVTEQVVVTSDAALVDSVSSDIGMTVQAKQIENLPLNGRNFTQLATLLPGVVRGVPSNVATGQNNNAETFRYSSSSGAALVVNGSRPQANNFMLDGLDNNESLVNTIAFFPPAEAIQEFKAQTNIAPAEYGRAGGAIVNTSIKSGSNDIHGSAFEFLRNSELDARPTFAPSVAPFRRNQFGGTLSGPVVKNKLFFFGDYQGFRQSTPLTVDHASVPTALMRQGDFSELLNPAVSGLSQAYIIRDLTTGNPFPNNRIPPERQDAVGLNYLKAFPTPNVAGKVQQNYVIQRQNVQNFDDFDVRTDWNATENDRIFGRFSYAEDGEDTSTRLPGLPAGYGSGSQFSNNRGVSIGYTHIFTASLYSDLRLGYLRTNLGYLPPYGSTPISAQLGIPNANVSPLLGGGALIGGWNNQLEYTGDYGTYQVPENTYQVAETLSWAKGNHMFKFGANIIRRQVNMFRPKAGKGYFFLWGDGVGAGSTGYEVADVLAGFVNNYQIGSQEGMFGTRSWENGLYLQDDWRVTRRLTLNLGLRYDLLTPPSEVYGRQSNFNLATGAVLLASGGSDALVQSNNHNFAPRAGFAYDVRGNGKTVVRGGFGMFYFLDRGGIDNQLGQNPPFSGLSQYNFTDGYRITLSGMGPMGAGSTGNLNSMLSTGALPGRGFVGLNLTNPQNISMAVTKQDNATSYMEQWNLQVQHELPQSVVVSVGYVGAAGHHLIDRYNINEQLLGQASGVRFYPGLGNLDVMEARGNSIYHALQMQVSRRFAAGLQFTAAYTFSKTMDDGTGANATYEQLFQSIALDRALADVDVRNRFVLSGVYELPFGKGRRFGSNIGRAEDALIGGWQFNTILAFQSGLPFTLDMGGSPAHGRPDLIGKLTTYPDNTQQYFDTKGVAATPTNAGGVLLRQGTLGRNTLIGPGSRTMDLSLFKNFTLTERFKLEFRAEAFNVTNSPVFQNPGAALGSGNFGVINQTLQSSERQLQGVLRLFF